ncbi:hypothetical protein AZI87_00600 [Bdellovibrio bacteriovorus]|uniref:Uncharacterized protein n=1 Tax=Bdellovibrio bacteriovorus TaxID=959 RepID=A0A161PSV9_BDEBC|nr:hypothetical protein [Bdellovibrio bacteriovorus]KYG67816.1 hypothetical protein AZI87_00600 [Bdellovibrio bacteriovorus]
MKYVILVSLFCLAGAVQAGVCKDSDGGVQPSTAGKVIYSLGDENCLGDSCYTQMIKEHDRCLDAQKVLEFSCQNGQPLEKEINCAGDHVCQSGACVKK